MILYKKYLNNQAPYSYLIRFSLLFIFLYFSFPFYRGITGEGGMIYSSFVAKYLNLITGLTSLLTNAAKTILQALDYTVSQKNYHTLRIMNSRGISVNPSCLGWGVMSFWAAFVIADSTSFFFKIKWLIIGLVSILLLNIVRIVLIALANHLHWNFITTLDPHQTFNFFSYCLLFILILIYLKIQKKHQNLFHKGKRNMQHAIS